MTFFPLENGPKTTTRKKKSSAQRLALQPFISIIEFLCVIGQKSSTFSIRSRTNERRRSAEFSAPGSPSRDSVGSTGKDVPVNAIHYSDFFFRFPGIVEHVVVPLCIAAHNQRWSHHPIRIKEADSFGVVLLRNLSGDHSFSLPCPATWR